MDRYSYSRRLPRLISELNNFMTRKRTDRLRVSIKFCLHKLFSPTDTGQVSAPICCLMTLRRLMFLINSRPRLFFATRRYPFSLSYEVILPSSLERVISRPLVFSTYPLVSVCGTGQFLLIAVRAFLGSLSVIQSFFADCTSSGFVPRC